jgi:2-polyprenyl-3-methyl-5-hydroxy-6-metoxy-1,4-benzoquinol methylase
MRAVYSRAILGASFGHIDTRIPSFYGASSTTIFRRKDMHATADDIASVVTRRFAEAGIRLGTLGSDADIIMTPAAYPLFLKGGTGVGDAFKFGHCRAGAMSIKDFTTARIKARMLDKPEKTNASQQSLESGPLIAEHYEAGNGFYETILDPYMQYSCAIFDERHATLDTAQRNKLLLTGCKQHLAAGDSLLDIGCGWGGLLRHHNERWQTVGTGITLSDRQLELARKHNAGRSNTFLNRNYRELEGEWDHIVSVGMFEHVGTEHYDAFFSRCKRILKPGGDMLLHAILGIRGSRPTSFAAANSGRKSSSRRQFAVSSSRWIGIASARTTPRP